MSEAVPVMVPLAEPRELVPAERALLDSLVAHTRHPGLAHQARSAVVVGTCSCGCPSVHLKVGGPKLSTVDMLRFSAHGREDVFGIHAHTKNAGLEVVVHVLGGEIAELEIYAGEDTVAVLPNPKALTTVDIY